MTQQQLTEYNLGRSLDGLANLDPRGYGVCRILYDAARREMGEPLTMHAARRLAAAVKREDFVYILTGFVLLPHKKAETDGIIGAVLLARALVKAFGAKPVLVCPAESAEAAHALAGVCGLHSYDAAEEIRELPVAMAVIPFPKAQEQATAQADALLAGAFPCAVVSIEAPGANGRGEYHNAAGLNVTALEAKLDVLFAKCQEAGVPSIAVGDLGNEIGMGRIAPQLARYVPRAGPGRCRCGCGGGIAAATAADCLVTATVSDWGCYGMIAALAFLMEDIELLHDADLEREACAAAVRAGLVDMHGWRVPAIDGFGLAMNTSIVTLMRECVTESLRLRQSCKPWFEEVIALGFYEGKA